MNDPAMDNGLEHIQDHRLIAPRGKLFLGVARGGRNYETLEVSHV
jgi:hypothetical protein